MKKIFPSLFFIMLCICSASAQNVDPMNNESHKSQYSKSDKKVEKESQDAMKKQTDDFVRKKKYRKLTRKGKPSNTGKAKPESMILYLDKKELIA